MNEEQQKKLASAASENREASRAAFQNFQNMSDDERREAGEKLRQEGDKRLLAAITDEQREQFSKLKGEELEIDRSQLVRFGRGGGNQN